MATSKFSTQYSHPKSVGFDTGRESKVRTSEQDSTDINLIMDRFNRTGKLPTMQTQPPRFGDARGVDYATALVIVKDAQEAFLKLPAATRKQFDNDPQQLEVFLSKPENHAKAVDLGLMKYQEPSHTELLTDLVKNTKKEAAPPKN